MRHLVVCAGLLLATAAAGATQPGDEQPQAPHIRVEPEGFDFGKALPNKTLRKEFTLSNFGDKELVIEGVSTTCGCTAAITTDSKLKPGGSTQLRVTLETRSYTGRIERQVLVRSNDPETPLVTVKLRATVEAADARSGEKPR